MELHRNLTFFFILVCTIGNIKVASKIELNFCFCVTLTPPNRDNSVKYLFKKKEEKFKS